MASASKLSTPPFQPRKDDRSGAASLQISNCSVVLAAGLLGADPSLTNTRNIPIEEEWPPTLEGADAGRSTEFATKTRTSGTQS